MKSPRLKAKTARTKSPLWNTRMAQWDDRHGSWLLRVWVRELKKSGGTGYRVKCGDCDKQLDIIDLGDCIEINGVCTSKHQWRQLLGPLLRKHRR